MKTGHCLLITLLLLIAGCEEESIFPRPADLLAEDDYITIFIELQLFDAFIQSADSTGKVDSLKTELFSYYQISEERFLNSHRYYQSDMDAQNVRIDSAVAIINAKLDSLAERPVNLLQLQTK